jgi:hypothetical protein
MSREMSHDEERSPGQPIPREMMLGGPGGMESQFFGELHLFEQIVEDLRVGTAFGPWNVVEEGVSHGDLSVIGGVDS